MKQNLAFPFWTGCLYNFLSHGCPACAHPKFGWVNHFICMPGGISDIIWSLILHLVAIRLPFRVYLITHLHLLCLMLWCNTVSKVSFGISLGSPKIKLNWIQVSSISWYDSQTTTFKTIMMIGIQVQFLSRDKFSLIRLSMSRPVNIYFICESRDVYSNMYFHQI